MTAILNTTTTATPHCICDEQKWIDDIQTANAERGGDLTREQIRTEVLPYLRSRHYGDCATD